MWAGALGRAGMVSPGSHWLLRAFSGVEGPWRSWTGCTQSCLTLCKPVDYSPPGSFVRMISQTIILEWV